MIGSGAVIIWPLIARMLSGGREIGTLEATRLMNRNALVLDIRDAAEFTAGHIPNAKHIPLAELNQRINELAKFKEKPVIISSADNSIITGKAMRVLMKNQFTDVYQLKGGLVAWQQASLPMER